MKTLEISPFTTLIADKIVSVQKGFCPSRVAYYVSVKTLGGFEERLYCESEAESDEKYTEVTSQLNDL